MTKFSPPVVDIASSSGHRRGRRDRRRRKPRAEPGGSGHTADMDVYLSTDRLVLRRFTPRDADALVELDRDPEVMHYITGGVTTSRAESEADVLPAFLGYYARCDRFGFWAALDPHGDFIGWFHLRSYGDTPIDEPELG